MADPIMSVVDVSAVPDATAPVVVADCCAPRGEYQYMRINGAWFQVGFLRCKQEGSKTHWHGYANPATACQHCGRAFGPETATRTYHAGAFSPVDSVVETLRKPK